MPPDHPLNQRRSWAHWIYAYCPEWRARQHAPATGWRYVNVLRDNGSYDEGVPIHAMAGRGYFSYMSGSYDWIERVSFIIGTTS